jgi:cell volume regulation protein A
VTRDVLATIGVLLAAGLVMRSVAAYTGIPEILLLVVAGAVLGPHAAGVVEVAPGELGAQLVFTVGVSAILFFGGLNLSLGVLRQVATSLAMLVVPGVLVTAAITGAAAHLAFGVPWDQALLIGAVLSPTDPAILIPLFLRTRLRPKVAQTVIAESAFNDPTGAVLALAIAGAVVSGDHSLSGPSLDFVREVAESAAIGIVAGLVLSVVICSRRFGIWRESAAVAALAMIVIAYVSLDSAGGSGYLGAFLAGLIVGNMGVCGLRMHPSHESELRMFAGNVSDIATLLVFLVLGSNLPLGELPGHLLAGIAVIGALLLVARPVAVLLCTAPDRRARWTRAELAFLCWTRETGVVPAALVGILAAEGVPGSAILASVVAIAVVATLVLQAMPAGALARRLGLTS